MGEYKNVDREFTIDVLRDGRPTGYTHSASLPTIDVLRDAIADSG